MAVPALDPVSTTSAIVLSSTGTTSDVLATLPYKIYAESSSALYDANFISGATDQVAYTYKKLGGDVLDIELTVGNVYSAYEEAVLEYSYIVNIHQAKNIVSNVLGGTTGTFDHDGHILTGENINLKYPKFDYAYARRVTEGVVSEAGFGGHETVYSASFSISASVQDYDLQKIVSSSALDSSNPYLGLVDNKKILIKKVFYKTPYAMWRFFGYYGGISVVGNLSTYGMYADDSTFEVVPSWQNKAQAIAYEDSIYTRVAHFSYELKNNKIRIYPVPTVASPAKIWFEFIIPRDSWKEDTNATIGVNGINNINTLPFANIPYKNINSIGKQWIRRFALALCKEVLGQIRGKFSTVPIPGESVTLNHSELLSQAKEEQEKLREELKTILDEVTYKKLIEGDSEIVENTMKIMQQVPVPVFVG